MDLTNLETLPKPQVEVTMEQAEAAEALGNTEKTHDPKEIEAQMLAAEEKRLTQQSDPEEVACMSLKMYQPIFNNLVDQLSNRQLRRVLKGLTEFPFGKNYTPADKLESECFAIGKFLNDAKMVLVIKTYSDNKEQIMELAAEAARNTTVEFGEKPENNEEQPKEVTNG